MIMFNKNGYNKNFNVYRSRYYTKTKQIEENIEIIEGDEYLIATETKAYKVNINGEEYYKEESKIISYNLLTEKLKKIPRIKELYENFKKNNKEKNTNLKEENTIELNNPEEITNIIKAIEIIIEERPENIPMEVLMQRSSFKKLNKELKKILNNITN